MAAQKHLRPLRRLQRLQGGRGEGLCTRVNPLEIGSTSTIASGSLTPAELEPLDKACARRLSIRSPVTHQQHNKCRCASPPAMFRGPSCRCLRSGLMTCVAKQHRNHPERVRSSSTTKIFSITSSLSLHCCACSMCETVFPPYRPSSHAAVPNLALPLRSNRMCPSMA